MAQQLERTCALFQLRRYADAERELRGALVEEPDNAFAHAMLGISLAFQNELGEARRVAAQAVELDPTLPYAFYAHGLACFQARQLDSALESIRTALRLDVANADYLYLLGAVLFNLGRVRESLNAVERGLAADPEHVDCMNLRGVAQRKLKRWNESRKSFAAALAIDPENAASHLAQGALLLSQGEAGAVEHLLEARRLDPIEANDGQAIAAALGRQLPPFRWIAPFVPRWYLWRRRRFGPLRCC